MGSFADSARRVFFLSLSSLGAPWRQSESQIHLRLLPGGWLSTLLPVEVHLLIPLGTPGGGLRSCVALGKSLPLPSRPQSTGCSELLPAPL